jgi:thiamine-monophosphate kinase
MALNEFSLIEKFFNREISPGHGVVQSIGDDCAIVEVPNGYQLAISIDSLIAGVHFPEHSKAYDIGYKALAVNLSDCAAMGATPLWATLALTLPKPDETWLKDFAEGFFVMANSAQVSLIGGDTTQGPLAITIQIHGILPKGKALLRSSAKIGDDVYVTGTLGDAGLALQTILGKLPKLETDSQNYIESRLNKPTARLKTGQALLDIAHACIDISDGLAADLQHILTASKVGAEIELDQLPLSSILLGLEKSQAINLALHSGDDYELCFTAPIEMRQKIEAISNLSHTPITKIGRIIEDTGLFGIADKQRLAIKPKGYVHFT